MYFCVAMEAWPLWKHPFLWQRFIWGAPNGLHMCHRGRWKAKRGAVWIRVCWRSVGKLQCPGSSIKLQKAAGNTSHAGTRARWLRAHLPKCCPSCAVTCRRSRFCVWGTWLKVPCPFVLNIQRAYKAHRKLERGDRHRNWQAFKNSKTEGLG